MRYTERNKNSLRSNKIGLVASGSLNCMLISLTDTIHVVQSFGLKEDGINLHAMQAFTRVSLNRSSGRSN